MNARPGFRSVVAVVAGMIASGLTSAPGQDPKADAGVVLKGHTRPVTGIAWRPDGKALATGSEDKDGTVRVWDPATGKQTAKSIAHPRAMVGLSWRPDGKAVMASSTDGMLRVFSPTGYLLASLRGNVGAPPSAEWRPDGKLVAVTAAPGLDGVQVWDPAANKVIAKLAVENVNALSAAWRPDGKALAAGMGDGTVRLWDADKWKQTAKLDGHGDRSNVGVAWRPDGGALASCGNDLKVRVWAAAGGAPTAELEGLRGDGAVAWRPDGKAVAAVGADNQRRGMAVIVWDVETGKALTTIIDERRNNFARLAWRPDGTAVATTSKEGAVQVWNAATGKEVVFPRGDVRRGSKVAAWKPDGTELAVGYDDGTARIHPVPATK